MIAPEHKEEILQFINGKIRKSKREHPYLSRLAFALKPSISSLTSGIPQCAMNYKLREIIDFLIDAEQERKILF